MGLGCLQVRAPFRVLLLVTLILVTWSMALRSALSPQPAQAALPSAAAARSPAAVARAERIQARAEARQRREARRRAARRARRQAALHHPIVSVRPGQSVEIHSAPNGSVVTTLGSTDEFGSTSSFSVVKRRGDWVGVPTRALSNGDLGWIRLDPSVLEESSTPWSVEVDLSEQRAQLIHGEEVARSFTVAIGRSTSPTPTGRFSITDEITSGLNPVYGCCALALSAHQPNLPAGWTGGDQIAIHGSPDNSVGGAISDGCLHATTDDLEALIAKLPLGAPVVIHS
jgi:lipoprotein-anchoring transpeptidase ErfK/SrfK